MSRPKADAAEPNKLAIDPPKTFRERFLHALPNYNGPYNVGYLEIEAPAREPRPISDLKRDGKPLLRLETVLFSVYYPADLRSHLNTPKGLKSLSRANWLPPPRLETSRGYAKFLNAPYLPVTAYIACTSMFTKMPAFRNAKLAAHWPHEMLQEESQAGAKARQEENVPGGGRPSFPVVVFSHGMGGSRSSCSTICGELASYGFVVVAVEHRDGSGARTFVNVPDGSKIDDGGDGNDNDDGDNNSKSQDGGKKRKKGTRKGKTTSESPRTTNPYYSVDYIYSETSPRDTSPHSDHGVDTVLRTAQIELRIAEIEEAFHCLEMINKGRGREVYEMNLRKNGYVGSNSRGLDGVDWNDWEGKMFLEGVTVMGHSFGGTTTVQIARTKALSWVGQCILLDAWAPAVPVPEAGEGPEKTISRPLMSISSEAFVHWEDNFDRLVGFCQEARHNDALCWMLTIRGSTHLCQTDFALLYSHWMSFLMKSVARPKRAFFLTLAATLEFLKITLPPEQTKFSHWVDQKLLRKAEVPADPSDPVSQEYRPTDKHIAFRLRIPNELSVRTKSWLHRKSNWLSCCGCCARDDDDVAHGDGVGGGVVGGGDGSDGSLGSGPVDEVWVHYGPSHEQVESHIAENEWASAGDRQEDMAQRTVFWPW